MFCRQIPAQIQEMYSTIFEKFQGRGSENIHFNSQFSNWKAGDICWNCKHNKFETSVVLKLFVDLSAVSDILGYYILRYMVGRH